MAPKLGDLAKIPTKQKAMVAVLFCLLVGVGYYYLYYRDASRQVASLESNLASLRSKIKEQEAIAGNLKSFQEEVRRLEEKLSAFPVVGTLVPSPGYRRPPCERGFFFMAYLNLGIVVAVLLVITLWHA